VFTFDQLEESKSCRPGSRAIITRPGPASEIARHVGCGIGYCSAHAGFASYYQPRPADAPNDEHAERGCRLSVTYGGRGRARAYGSVPLRQLFARPPVRRQSPADAETIVDGWRRTILQIAREEMGHLMTVQNLLRLLGMPLKDFQKLQAGGE
jgi:hypothetical protein